MNSCSEIVYHASYMKIEFPQIRKYRFTKDFSWGFYFVTMKEQAEKYASIFNTPVVNVYEFKYVKTLNIKRFEDYNDEWLEFVINCRNGNTHEYDVVIGPIADDTIYDYLEAYDHGQMNKQEFIKSMKLKYCTYQISIHTIQALDCINFIKSYKI